MTDSSSGTEGLARGPALRDRILREATRLFAERGYSGASVREVAQASGCTKPALYYYFTNKDALFREAIQAESDIVTGILEDGMRGAGTLRERMTRGFRRFLDHVRAHPDGIRLVWRVERYGERNQPRIDIQSIRTMHEAMVEQMLAEGMAHGEVRSDVCPHDAAHALLGMIDRRLELWERGEDLPSDLPERVLELFFRGVSPGFSA